MPIRFATSRILKSAAAALIAGLLAGTGSTATAQGTHGDVTLTLEQAREMAGFALRSGDPGTAIQLSRGLLEANPKDPVAHYIIATAHARLSQPTEGRKAAARAYRHAQTPEDKFQAAQLAAQMAWAEDRPTLSQVWLRRTAVHAPDERTEQLVARDYRILRIRNPFAFRIQTDLRPSNNVNNGSDTALQIIDGVPVTGFLGGAARALSGLIASADLSASYRLRANERSATTLGGRLYLQRVALSSEAKAQAPMVTGSDFAATIAEVSLRHGFSVRPEEKRGTASTELAFGESWYGGHRSYRFARGGLDRNWRFGEGRTLNLNGLVETRFRARFRANDANILGLGAVYGHPLRNGDRVTLSMAMRDTNALHPNGTFTSASVRAGYNFGQPVGGVRVSAGLVFGYSDYPVYQSGLFMVPGGRQDKSIYGDVSLFLDRMDYAGFAPMLRFRTGRKDSNDSRFTTREVSVSLGIESKF